MGWVREEIALLFSQIHDSDVLRRLEISGEKTAEDVQVANAEHFWRLTVCMASERAWHLLSYSKTLPEMLAAILDEDSGRSNDCFRRFCAMAKVYLEAVEALQDHNNTDRVVT